MVFVSMTEVLEESKAEVSASNIAEPLVLLIVYASFFVGMMTCWLLDVVTDILLRLTVKKPSPSLRVSPSQPSGNMRDLPMPRVVHSSSPANKNTSPEDVRLELPPGDQGSAGHLVAESALHDAADQLGASQDFGPLMRTAVLIILALSFHNLPEGLATFVGYMSSPELGITIAVAIAIHNIPEGIAIGVPMYFATGSRWKAIGWAAVSGVAEPVGALIGLAIYQSGHLNPMAMGIILGFTGGIMTGIAIRELIPRSIYYDDTNKWTTNGIIAGMAIMALSFVLLALMG